MATKSRLRRWSPLTCIAPASLSPSGLFILETKDGEVETLVRTYVELRYDGTDALPLPKASAVSATAAAPWTARDADLACHVTTHRIALLDEKDSVGGAVPLSLVHVARPAGGPSFRSPMGSYKIELCTHGWGTLVLVFRGGEARSYSQAARDRADTLEAVQRALQRRAWDERERQASKEAARPSRAIAARKVGVDAILTQNKLRHRENANLAEATLGGRSEQAATSIHSGHKSRASKDIDAFLREATELIKVIQKYTATIERGNAGAAPASKDTAKLVGMMENMGMASALSAEQTGSDYHKQLARQLTDFLRRDGRLAQAGGMMTLTDVYCLFNRARGTNMISPEDLLCALELMGTLRLGLSKREFASGVVVVQDNTFDDEAMARKLADLAAAGAGSAAAPPPGITAMDVSRSMKTSVLLANEQLASAEQMGWLCRDATIEGVRYFPNLFRTGDFSSFALGRVGVPSSV